MALSVLDNPQNRERVFDLIRRQRGSEYNAWQLVGITDRAYYYYKARHPDFKQAVEAIMQSCLELPAKPDLSNDLAQKHEEWVRGGCVSTHLQRKFRAVPLLNPDGTPQRDKQGKRMHDLDLEYVIENTYKQGYKEEVLRRYLGEAKLTEKAFKLFVTTAYKFLIEDDFPDTARITIAEFLRRLTQRMDQEFAKEG